MRPTPSVGLETDMRTPPTQPRPEGQTPRRDRSEDASALPEGEDLNDHLSAEQDVADSLDAASAHRFDNLPQDGPLNFDDGTDMGHPRGDTRREGGTWDAEGGDQGRLKPPAEILSDRNSPSDRKRRP